MIVLVPILITHPYFSHGYILYMAEVGIKYYCSEYNMENIAGGVIKRQIWHEVKQKSQVMKL